MSITEYDVMEAKVLIENGYTWVARDNRPKDNIGNTNLFAYTKKPIKSVRSFILDMEIGGRALPIPRGLFKEVSFETGAKELKEFLKFPVGDL